MGGGGRAWLALGLLTWFAARAKEKGKEPPPLYREVLRRGSPSPSASSSRPADGGVAWGE